MGTAVDIKLVDIERIEVLRGPQGTLYGAGSMGGAVRNIPNAPSLDELEGGVTTGFSSVDGSSGLSTKLTGLLNVPIVKDELSLRIVGYQFDNKGYVDMESDKDPGIVSAAEMFGGELNTRNDVGDSEFIGGRLALLWEPTEDFSSTLSYVNQDLEQDGALIVSGDKGYDGSAFGLNGKFDGYKHEGRWDESEFMNLTVNYDLGWGDFLSSSTISDGEYGKMLDAGRLFLFPTATLNITDAEGYSQEFRVSSRIEGPLQFLVGAYYENLQNITDTSILWTGEDSQNFFGAPELYEEILENHVQQKAAFGELSYEINEDVKLTMGGRWFDYDRRYRQVAEDAPFSPGGVFTDEEIQEDGTKGKVNLAYTPSDVSLVYMQWAQGFRLGRPIQVQPQALCDTDNDGFMDGTNTRLNTSGAVDSDNLDSIELGAKLGFMDNRLIINTALYHIDWEGIPVQVVSPSGLCGTVSNAGEAQSQGFEVETNYHVSEYLLLGLSFSYVDAELTADTEGLGGKGDRLPYTPRSNVSLDVNYDFVINGFDGYINASYSHVGGFHTDLAEMSPELGDYGHLNLRTGLAISDHLDIEIYSKNLTNSDELAFSSFFGNYRQKPREIGVDFRYNF